MVTFTVRLFLTPSGTQSSLFMMEDAVTFTAKIFYGPQQNAVITLCSRAISNVVSHRKFRPS